MEEAKKSERDSTPSTPDALVGKSLRGRTMLGVPKQKSGIPDAVLRLAEVWRIEIREIDATLP
jgi:hypothetical protein